MSETTMTTNQGADRLRAVRRGRAEDRRELPKLAGDGFYDGLIFHRIIRTS